MFRKYKKLLISILLTVAFVIATGCNAVGNKSNTINAAKAEAVIQQIVDGKTTYSEIKDMIGFDGTDVGSGAIIYEWNIEDGGVLRVWFKKPEGAAGIDYAVPDALIVSTSNIELSPAE